LPSRGRAGGRNEIGIKHPLRSGKGSLSVDYPILFPQGSDVTQEGTAHPKWFQGRKELQVAGIEGLPEVIEKQSTKQTRQNLDRQEEILAARNPSRAIRGNAATRNHAMQMRIVMQGA
jgi:hypothetical protein